MAEQVVADERDPLALVDEQRVGRAVPGPRHDAQVAAARRGWCSPSASTTSACVGVRLAAQELPERLGVGDHRLGHAVVAHQREREAAVGLAALVVVRAVGGRALVGGDAGARARGDRRREAAVVEVVVRDQHELEVLEPHAGAAQAGLERGQRLVVARARVDQRQRVAPQQPGVDRADVREREAGCGRERAWPESSSSMTSDRRLRPICCWPGLAILRRAVYDLKSVWQTSRRSEHMSVGRQATESHPVRGRRAASRRSGSTGRRSRTASTGTLLMGLGAAARARRERRRRARRGHPRARQHVLRRRRPEHARLRVPRHDEPVGQDRPGLGPHVRPRVQPRPSRRSPSSRASRSPAASSCSSPATSPSSRTTPASATSTSAARCSAAPARSTACRATSACARRRSCCSPASCSPARSARSGAWPTSPPRPRSSTRRWPTSSRR